MVAYYSLFAATLCFPVISFFFASTASRTVISCVLSFLLVLFVGLSYQIGAPDWITYSSEYASCSSDLVQCVSSLFTWNGGFEPLWRLITLAGALTSPNYFSFQFFLVIFLLTWRHRQYILLAPAASVFFISLDFFILVFPLLNVWRQFLALNLLSTLVLSLLMPRKESRFFTVKCFFILALIFFAHIPTFLVTLVFLLVPIEVLLDLLLFRLTKPVFRRFHLYVFLAILAFGFLVGRAISISSYFLKYSSYIAPIQGSPSFLNLAFVFVLYSFTFSLIAKPVRIASSLSDSLPMAKIYLKRAFIWSSLLAVILVFLPFFYPLLFRIRFVSYELFIVSAAYIYRSMTFNPTTLLFGFLSLLASSFFAISTAQGSPHLYLPYCVSIHQCPVSDRTELIYRAFN